MSRQLRSWEEDMDMDMDMDPCLLYCILPDFNSLTPPSTHPLTPQRVWPQCQPVHLRVVLTPVHRASSGLPMADAFAPGQYLLLS